MRIYAPSIGSSADFQRQYSQAFIFDNEVIFTDCGMRDYWDEQHSLTVDRDINAAINLKKLGLDIFPTIKRAKRESFVSAQ
jgi:hypothetical protein